MQVGYGEGRKSESQGGSRKWDRYVELERIFFLKNELTKKRFMPNFQGI